MFLHKRIVRAWLIENHQRAGHQENARGREQLAHGLQCPIGVETCSGRGGRRQPKDDVGGNSAGYDAIPRLSLACGCLPLGWRRGGATGQHILYVICPRRVLALAAWLPTGRGSRFAGSTLRIQNRSLSVYGLGFQLNPWRHKR